MARNEFTYDQLKPLIVSEEVDNRQVYVQFALPGSDEVFDAQSTVSRDSSMTGRVKEQVSRQVANQARRGLSSMLRGILGGGFLGRTATQVVNTSTRESTRNMVNAPSRGQIEEAVVNAFRRVSRNFSYDDATGEWGKPGPRKQAAAPKAEPSGFQAQLEAHPVNTGFEKDVLARVLAHIAYADGELGQEEIEFFEDSIPASLGSVQELAQKDPVSAIEAEEIRPGVRETIYMLAWTISSVDMDVAGAEEESLKSYAVKFGIADDRKAELEKFAKVNVLENYMTPDMARSELFELAGKIGLSDDDAERAKIHWMKRQ